MMLGLGVFVGMMLSECNCVKKPMKQVLKKLILNKKKGSPIDRDPTMLK